MEESYVYLSGRTNKTVLTISREESKTGAAQSRRGLWRAFPPAYPSSVTVA